MISNIACIAGNEYETVVSIRELIWIYIDPRFFAVGQAEDLVQAIDRCAISTFNVSFNSMMTRQDLHYHKERE